MKEKVPRHPHIHHSTEKWEVTSGYKLGDDFLKCTVLNVTYPGEIGTYIFPEDSVFTLKGKKSTTVTDWEEVLSECRQASVVESRNTMFNLLIVSKNEDADSEHESECVSSDNGFDSDAEAEGSSSGEEDRHKEKGKLLSDISDSDSE